MKRPGSFINNDLLRPRLSIVNIAHTVITAALGWLIYPVTGHPVSFPAAYCLMFLWEIGDGFKPWYHAAPIEIRLAKFPSLNWWKRELLFSDKFSLQDICYWNLLGMVIAIATYIIIFAGG